MSLLDTPEVWAFARLFDQRRYHLAHEALEELWRRDGSELRPLYKGLVQLAAAFVHLQNGNWHGVSTLAGRALECLRGYDEEVGGLDLRELQRRLRRLVSAGQKVREGSPPPGDLELALLPLFS